MAWSLVRRVQASSAANSGAASVTFPAAVAGHLLVAWCNSDATPTSPAGWVSNLAAVNFCAVQVSSKIAAGGETSVSFTLSASDSWNAEVFEFAGNGASATEDKKATQNTPSGTSVPTGTTATLTGANDLAIAFFGNDGNENASAITGGFGSLVTLVATGTSSPLVAAASAYQFLSATTGVGGTFTIGAGAASVVGAVVAWQGAAGGTTQNGDATLALTAAGVADGYVPSAWAATHAVTIGG